MVVRLVCTFWSALRAVAEGRFEVNRRVPRAVDTTTALRRVTCLLVVIRVRTIVVGIEVVAEGAVERGVQIVIIVECIVAFGVTRRVQSIVTCKTKKWATI